MNKSLLIAVAALFALGSATAADVDAGRKIADTQCAACHGKDGKTPTDPSYPKLAGQHAAYLEKALNDYQTGARNNAIMSGMAKPLSKQDVRNLASFYASLPGPLTNRR